MQLQEMSSTGSDQEQACTQNLTWKSYSNALRVSDRKHIRQLTPDIWPNTYTSNHTRLLTWNVCRSGIPISDLKAILQWPSDFWHETYTATNSGFLTWNAHHYQLRTTLSWFLTWNVYCSQLTISDPYHNQLRFFDLQRILQTTPDLWLEGIPQPTPDFWPERCTEFCHENYTRFLEQNNKQQHSATIWLWHEMTWNEGSVVKLT